MHDSSAVILFSFAEFRAEGGWGEEGDKRIEGLPPGELSQ